MCAQRVQIVGMKLQPPPGIINERGTQAGTKRSIPSPVFNAFSTKDLLDIGIEVS